VPEWLEGVNQWASIPLQIGGFAVAIWQIVKSRTAAEAAQSAAISASTLINSKLLMTILPQLNQVESNLEWAIGRGDADAASHYLGAWRWQAGQLRGHLGDTADAEFATLIQGSIVAAADSRIAIQESPEDLAKRSVSARKAISGVTGRLGEIAARSSTENEEIQ
jgi:hypothetical protein